jgi:hypothetical protein
VIVQAFCTGQAVDTKPLPKGGAILIHFFSQPGQSLGGPLEAASASEWAGLIPLYDGGVFNYGDSTSPSASVSYNFGAAALFLRTIGTYLPSGSTSFTPASGNTSLPGATARQGQSTVSLFSEYLISATGESIASASDGTLSATASWVDSFILVGADPATHFSVTPAQGLVAPGRPFSITVTALDDSGHTDDRYTGTVHFTSNRPAGLPADYTFTLADGGSHTFSVRPGPRGRLSITVTDTLAPSLKGSGVYVVSP